MATTPLPLGSIAAPPFDLEGMMNLLIPTRTSLISASAVLSLIMMACAGDPPTVPLSPSARLDAAASRSLSAGNKLMVCHMSDEDPPHIIGVSPAAREAHINHGDHIAQFVVDKTRADIGDGIHFGRIGDAIAEARAVRVARDEQETAACRITIVVAPGTYRGSINESTDPNLERFPLLIDVPDITLQGALAMQIDENGRATGIGATDDVSTISASPALVSILNYSEPLVAVNGQPNGFKGNGTIVEGFAFQSGHVGVDTRIGGLGILGLRVGDLVVRGNRFEAGFSESVDLRAASGHVEHNHLGGGGGTCDICLAGPGDYRAEGNRLLAGGIPGILVVPATGLKVPQGRGIDDYVLPTSATVNATLVNNEVRDHQRTPVGVGIRVAAVGVGAPTVAGLAIVEARDNFLVHNRFAMIVEAGFPAANTQRRGDIELTLHDNVFAASCQNNFLVSFSRHTTGLGIPPANSPYLLSSSYTLNLGENIAWDDVWYSHPAGFGNTLTVDSVVIPSGSRIAYDGTRTCSP